ncbi:hypothetical protein GOODEAATRI_031932 [Goodea atripinnis]|uniref:Uncharacterized protein n=1 Tax=Goodea atripinnis TaxID=208336 RepID=A0ABV0PTF3_9TELE
MSSTDIVVRHRIFHCCEESIVYPEKNVPSGQEGSPLPCLPVKKVLSTTLKDQLTKSIIYKFGRNAKRGSEKKTDKKQKQGSARRERKHVCLPPRAREKTHRHVSRNTFILSPPQAICQHKVQSMEIRAGRAADVLSKAN